MRSTNLWFYTLHEFRVAKVRISTNNNLLQLSIDIDVFLTPIKPRQKVVTAEDVQSSLYYLHVNQPEDARLLEPSNVGYTSGEGDVPNIEPAKPLIIPRKALLPEPPQYDSGMLAPDATTSYSSAPSNPSIKSNGKPVVAQPLSSRHGIQFTSNVGASKYSQRPVSPHASNHQSRQSAEILDFRKENASPALPPRRRSELPRLPPRPSHYRDSLPNYDGFLIVEEHPPRNSTSDRLSPIPSPINVFNERRGSPSPQRGRLQSSGSDQMGSSTPLGVSLTLIRRDPASSAQWNVALIEDPPVFEASSSALHNPSAVQKTKKSGAPLYIEINNPGYSKFLHNSDDIASLLSRRSDISEGSVRALDKDRTLLESNQQGHKDAVFRRRLWMEGSRFANGGFGHRRMNSSDSSFGLEAPRSSSESRSKEGVLDGFNNPAAPTPGWDNQGPEKRTSVFRGYEFLSPWNGRCEFSTGGGGQSLKVRCFQC